MARKKADGRVPRPRNAHVSAMRMRKSGAHGPTGKALRRKARMELKRKVDGLEVSAA